MNVEDRNADAAIYARFAAAPHRNCAAGRIADALESLLQFWAHPRCQGEFSEVVEVGVAEALGGTEPGPERLGLKLEEILA